MTLVLLVLAYISGSIPFALVIARRAAGIELQRTGSGNIGAANVFRTLGWSLGLLVVILDVGKGMAPVLIAQRMSAGPVVPTAAGVIATIAHMYPIWLAFHGGKGVATACGAFGILAPAATAYAVLVFGATVGITRYVSLGSILAAVALGPLAYLTGAPPAVVLGALITTVLVVQRHRSNLARLYAGTERRLGRRA